MRFKQQLFESVEIRLVCADPQIALNYLLQKGVIIQCVHWIDEITVDISMPKRAMKAIKEIEKKYHCEMIIKKINGITTHIRSLGSRAVMIIGILLFFFLSLYIQSHILFIEIRGNSSVAQREITENVEKCGLILGSSRKLIRSERIKNMLMESIPELQWVGITTTGCVATINVKERTNTEDTEPRDHTPASIVAAKDGTICCVTVEKGTILCQIGQRVTKGQTLISGMNHCGGMMLLTRAKGEVFAETERELVLKTIPAAYKRECTKQTDRRLSILFGKKLINLFKDSGILDSSCVRIVNKYNLQLPNGYILPVSLYCEDISTCSIREINQSNEQFQWILQQGSSYILSSMISGEIVNVDSQQTIEYNVIKYNVRYKCREMIGQIKKEELFYLNGKNG